LVLSLRAFSALDALDDQPPAAFHTSSLALRNQLRELAVDLPILSGTLLLYLAGRFEHFVRMSFQAHCDSLAEKCKRFDQLPSKMQNSLRAWTATVCIKPSKYGFDELEASGFITSLAANFAATEVLGTVNSACLSVTEGNMNPGTLAELYGRLAVSNLWSELSKQATLKAYLEVEKDQDAEKQAKTRLEDIMRIRNQIAHPSGSPVFPGAEQVASAVEYLAVLAGTLTGISRVHVAAFKPAT
jgi:hypothetical protein